MDYSLTKKVVNLTPHTVRVCVGKDIFSIEPSGKVARLGIKTVPHGTVQKMPIVLSSDGEITNVPEPEEGTVYIASSVVAKVLKREDVLSPDTTNNGVLQDGDGNVFAVKRLQCFSGG